MRRIRQDANGGCDYAKLHWAWGEHHTRWVRHVERMPKKLVCQDCRGEGGEYDDVLGWGQQPGCGPWEECGWCEGTGLVTPYRRAEWLRYRASLKVKS